VHRLNARRPAFLLRHGRICCEGALPERGAPAVAGRPAVWVSGAGITYAQCQAVLAALGPELAR